MGNFIATKIKVLSLIKTAEDRTFIRCDLGQSLEEYNLIEKADSPIIYFEVISKKCKVDKKHKTLTGGFVITKVKTAKYETAGIVETIPIDDDEIAITITEKENGKLKFQACLDSVSDPNTGLVTNWAIQSSKCHLTIYSKVASGYNPIVIKE